MDLIQQLENYQPYNEQEEKDVNEILRRLKSGEELYTRDNHGAHLSASAWVVSPNYQKVLMAYHKIYQSWAWLGGHADGDHDLLHVALKEVKEESGLDAQPVFKDIYSVEILTVDGHEKNGDYVSSHLHLNVTYLLMADDTLTPRVKPDENKDVAWFDREEALKASNEPWFVSRVYAKLNDKLKDFY